MSFSKPVTPHFSTAPKPTLCDLSPLSEFEGAEDTFTFCFEQAESIEAVQQQSQPQQIGSVSAPSPQTPSLEIQAIDPAFFSPDFEPAPYPQYQSGSDPKFLRPFPWGQGPLSDCSSNCSSPVSQHQAFEDDESAAPQVQLEPSGLENFYELQIGESANQEVLSPMSPFSPFLTGPSLTIAMPDVLRSPAMGPPNALALQLTTSPTYSPSASSGPLTPSTSPWYPHSLQPNPLGRQLPSGARSWHNLHEYSHDHPTSPLGLNARRASTSLLNSPHPSADPPEWIGMHANQQSNCYGPTAGYAGGSSAPSIGSPASSIHEISPNPQEQPRSFVEAFSVQVTQPQDNRPSASLAASHKRRKRAPAFFCEICNKDFTTKYNITNHNLIHRDVKDHRCDICNHEFRTRSVLVRHRRKNKKCKELAKRQGKHNGLES